jgi:hypothetical protein
MSEHKRHMHVLFIRRRLIVVVVNQSPFGHNLRLRRLLGRLGRRLFVDIENAGCILLSNLRTKSIPLYICPPLSF